MLLLADCVSDVRPAGRSGFSGGRRLMRLLRPTFGRQRQVLGAAMWPQGLSGVLDWKRPGLGPGAGREAVPGMSDGCGHLCTRNGFVPAGLGVKFWSLLQNTRSP
jgi:hypothetical protein